MGKRGYGQQSACDRPGTSCPASSLPCSSVPAPGACVEKQDAGACRWRRSIWLSYWSQKVDHHGCLWCAWRPTATMVGPIASGLYFPECLVPLRGPVLPPRSSSKLHAKGAWGFGSWAEDALASMGRQTLHAGRIVARRGSASPSLAALLLAAIEERHANTSMALLVVRK